MSHTGTATHCNTLPHTATQELWPASTLFQTCCLWNIAYVYTYRHCNILQSTNTLQQPTATYCNTILHTYTHIGTATHYYKIPRHTATQPNTLQHTATQPNTLQHPTATYCNTTQHTATQELWPASTLSPAHCLLKTFCIVRSMSRRGP